ncbi:MAG: hypothetical protein LC641_03465 [Spirochaeta sp.]|nr:hypothetical protein [Spirochaeta sp.]
MGMNVQDKERIGIGIAVALILHIGIFVGLSAHDWTDLQEPSAEEAPAEPTPAPATPQPQSERTSDPSPRPAPGPVDPLAQAPSRSMAEIEAEIRGEQPDQAPERARPERDYAPGDVFPDDSPGELPEWVRSIEERGISTAEMDSRDVQQVAQRMERDPEFEATLRRVIAGVEEAARTRNTVPGSADSDPAGEPDDDAGSNGVAGDRKSSDGGAAISGLRQGRGTPTMEFSFTTQELSALPPTVTIVVAFDVLPSGQVGSLMFVRRSGYTPVDQKVADRIRRWSFSRTAGTQTETGYFTLVISREDIAR